MSPLPPEVLGLGALWLAAMCVFFLYLASATRRGGYRPRGDKPPGRLKRPPGTGAIPPQNRRPT